MPNKTKRTTKKTTAKSAKKPAKVTKSTKATKVKAPAKILTKKKVVKQSKPFLNPKVVALVSLFIGLQLMMASGWYILYRKTILSFQVAPVVTVEQHTETPVKIAIANRKIELPIIPATINDGIWPVDDHNALHLATSAYPGERGNIVVYGHNTSPVFGNLKTAVVGDVVSVTSDTGVVHTYEVKEILRVKPSDIHVVLPTDHEVLTVYTCIGWLDSERLVLKAYPTDSASI